MDGVLTLVPSLPTAVSSWLPSDSVVVLISSPSAERTDDGTSPWTVRRVMLSGCSAFPSPRLNVSVCPTFSYSSTPGAWKRSSRVVFVSRSVSFSTPVPWAGATSPMGAMD